MAKSPDGTAGMMPRTRTATAGRRLRSLVLAILLMPACAATVAATSDVRILIDVSGSMKQSDPQNLRRSALRLVNQLLPEGTRAGVWLFAEKTEVLASPGVVDEKWKARTAARIERIHSRGLRTDIEQAIDTAAASWTGPGEDSDRNLILLTDGLVDVSKDPEASQASRERIVSEQVARLNELGVKVHAIGLSDEVDRELMRILSGRTGGWLETAQDADKLQRVFLHMLEQAASPTSVPLQGNRFQIDDQVSELTLLAFRDGERQTRLIAPDGAIISADTRARGLLWRAESGYDLITLSAPKPGEWQLDGVEDPDNRVVVVTDLGIETDGLPSALRIGASPPVAVWLTDHEKPVTRPALLQLAQASGTLSEVRDSQPQGAGAPPPDSPTSPAPTAPIDPATGAPVQAAPVPPDTGPQPLQIALTLDQESGRFQGKLDTSSLGIGTYRIDLLIDGGTFKRQMVSRLEILGPPIRVLYEPQQPSDESPAAALRISIQAEPDSVDPGSLRGYLLLDGPDHHDRVLQLPKHAVAPLSVQTPIQAPGAYRVSGHLMARTRGGDPLDFEPPPYQATFDLVGSAAGAQRDADPAQGAPFAWLTLVLYLLIGNAVAGLILGLTWWLLRGRAPGVKSGQSKTGKPA